MFNSMISRNIGSAVLVNFGLQGLRVLPLPAAGSRPQPVQGVRQLCTLPSLRPLRRQVFVLLTLDGRIQMGLADVDQHDLPHLSLPALGRGLHDEELHDLQRRGRGVESLAVVDLVLRPEILCDEPAPVDAEALVDVHHLAWVGFFPVTLTHSSTSAST